MKEEKAKGARRKKIAVHAAREIARTALGVALITVCAWITIPVFTVPYTLQTFAVAFVGALLGWKRGLAAVVVYVLMGLAGVPVFSGFKSGVATLFGPTGGYIVGFVFLVLITALFKLIPVKGKLKRVCLLFVGMVVGMAICYAFGTLWFVVMYKCTVDYALALCVVPYLLADAVKFIVAALIAVRLEKYIK